MGFAAAPPTQSGGAISNRTIGRLAGLTYVGVVLTGVFALAYVPQQLIDMSDPATAYRRISESDLLYRAGVAAEFACYALFAALMGFLHRLFSPHGGTLASLMALLGSVSVPIAFVATAHKEAVIGVISGTDLFALLDADARIAAATAQLRAYKDIIAAADIFWALWLLPFGALVLKTGLIPRLLGVFLVLGCLGGLADHFGPLFFGGYKGTIVGEFASIPGSIGEIGAAFWLFAFGARKAGAV